MKVAIIGVAHWHLKYFKRALVGQSGVEVVGVSDPADEIAQRVARDLGCTGYPDFRELCRRERPELAIVLGRHADMASAARHLMHEGVPFALEKPGGTTAAEVAGLADEAKALGAFASAAFGFRCSDMFRVLREVASGEPLLSMSVKAYGGSPWRYPSHAPWMLDPALSGGGAFINLGFHYVQLFRSLAGGEISVNAAAMSSAKYRLDIEEYAAVQLRSGEAFGTIETGYCFPGPGSDEHFSFRTTGHYFVVAGRGAPDIQVSDIDAVDAALRSPDSDAARRMSESPDLGGAVTEIPASTDRFPPGWGADLVRRVRAGEPPLEDLSDMAECMRVIESAYQAAGRTTTSVQQ